MVKLGQLRALAQDGLDHIGAGFLAIGQGGKVLRIVEHFIQQEEHIA